ncbi:MAG: Rpn family recombination-promoting nuclease/putative transposase [Clostridiales bacterium]|nr:Rpn family recombination-promoting nuclease/putative transposase [Clostridiales bacterium]
MTKLEYTFTDDTLFKSLFVKYPHLLKRLVAELLEIAIDSIGQFEITNPEIPPESLRDKFCRLDINMTVDGQRVDLEIQVQDEGDFPERTLFYWARDYSSALPAGGKYHELPRVVIISIMAFNLFDCEDYHSEFQPLEITRHTPLTDKQSLHYFELPKLPEVIDADDELKLWLSLFKAETEEELKQIEELEVPVMRQAIGAYRIITATPEFRERARLHEKARHDEAQALEHATEVATEVERAKWQGVVADKDAALADKDVALADKDAALADKDAALADKDAENARLREQLAALQTKFGEGE